MKKLIYAVLPLLLLGGCNKEELETSDSRFDTRIDDVKIPDPSFAPDTPGPFRVCFQEQEIGHKEGPSHIYYPSNQRNCEPVRGKSLVVIFHADGSTIEDYKELASHIASHGFVVALPRTERDGSNGYEVFGKQLLTFLDYLYGDPEWEGLINKKISLVGHSHGGKLVTLVGQHIANNYGSVESVIILAPASVHSKINFIPFENYTKSFLGITVFDDSDTNTNGVRKIDSENEPWPIMMTQYDVMAKSATKIHRDFVFGRVYGGKGHYFQNTHFTKGYITAHLLWRLNDYQDYIKYFKNQEALPNKPADQVYQIQHAEPFTKVLSDFETGTKEEHLLGGKIEYFGSIGFPHIAVTYLDDPQSPHNTQALTFFHFQAKENPLSYVRFYMEKEKNFKGYKYISFRITQVFNPSLNPTGVDKDVQILFTSGNKTAAKNLSQVGGKLLFPKKVSMVHAEHIDKPLVDVTQNIMRTYVIALDEFQGIDFSNLDALTFNFTDEPGTIYTLDDIEFIN